jgi:hypothetical protein
VNRPEQDATRLRAEVRAALAGDGLEQVVRELLALRFPAEGAGASLDEAGAALGMSPALVAHIEFAALCAIAAERTRPGAVNLRAGGAAAWVARHHSERGRQ